MEKIDKLGYDLAVIIEAFNIDVPDESALLNSWFDAHYTLDQFEQWLHAHRTESEAELIAALRHCDGGNLQAIVMVRDDFAMAASRFMRALDIRIVEGQNFATVDLFDVEHAAKVLTKFGQAFGKLPAQLSRLTDPEGNFRECFAIHFRLVRPNLAFIPILVPLLFTHYTIDGCYD